MIVGSDELRSWIVRYVAAVLDLDPDAIETDKAITDYGFDSAESVIMSGVMEEEFSIEVDPTVFFENPTIEGIVEALQARNAKSTP
jgi:acyl carrier protein